MTETGGTRRVIRAYLKSTAVSLRLWLRDRQSVFWTLAFPIIFAVSFTVIFARLPAEEHWRLILRVVAINMIAMGLFSLPTQLVTWRERGVLRRYLVTPLPPALLLLAEATAFCIVGGISLAVQLTVLLIVVAPSGPVHLPLAVLILGCGALTALALGLIIAATVPSAKLVPAVGQTLFLPMMFLSGATIPAEFLPSWLRQIGEYNPLGVMVRAAESVGEASPEMAEILLAAISLVVTAVLGLALAIGVFRWDPFTALRPSQWLTSAALIVGLLATPRVLKAVIAFTLLPTGTVYVHAGRLWDGTSEQLRSRVTIKIRAGRITDVVDGYEPPPAGATLVDARKLTVLPGLGDAHVHLTSGGLFFGGAFTTEPRKLVREHLKRYLRCGVTMVKSCGDAKNVVLSVRDSLRSGFLRGPAFVLVGPLFTAPGGHPAQFAVFMPDKREFVRELAAVAEVPEALADCLGEVDAIKAVYGGGIPPYFSYRRLEPEILRELIRQAHAAGLRISVHVDEPAELLAAAEMGADGIEHVPVTGAVPQAAWQTMVERSAVLIPTLAVYEGLMRMTEAERILEEPFVRETLSANEQEVLKQPFARFMGSLIPAQARAAMLAQAMANVRAAYQARVAIVAGSDAGNPGTFHGAALHRELRLLQEAGLPPIEVLKAATSRCADWLGLPAGRVQPGTMADLIAVDGNPLEDVQLLARLHWVMRLGRIEWQRNHEGTTAAPPRGQSAEPSDGG